MLKIAEFAYIISMFISVAGFAVHLTVRFKDLSATSSLAKQTSTTFFLLFILIFNISDYVIIYFGKSLGVEYVDWLYAFQNVMEVVLCMRSSVWKLNIRSRSSRGQWTL